MTDSEKIEELVEIIKELIHIIHNENIVVERNNLLDLIVRAHHVKTI